MPRKIDFTGQRNTAEILRPAKRPDRAPSMPKSQEAPGLLTGLELMGKANPRRRGTK